MKKIAVINDISGFGNCSLTASIPILSAMGNEVHPAPTAVLSAQSEYADYYCADLSDCLKNVLNKWSAQKATFDAIFTGYVPNAESFGYLFDFIADTDAPLLVDPVLGDNGSLYDNFTENHLENMRRLISFADYATPNFTEARLIAGEKYFSTDDCASFAEAEKKVKATGLRLTENFCEKVVITGVVYGKKVYNFVFNGGFAGAFGYRYYNRHFSGTGDIFASVTLGGVLSGKSFTQSVIDAGNFLNKCVALTVKENAEPQNGVQFQPFLKKL